MRLWGLLACAAAVLAIVPQPVSAQPSVNYSESNYSQWNHSEGDYSQWNAPLSCFRWYNYLERALVSRDWVTHQLQDAFFPVSGQAPFSLVVQYDIVYKSNGTWVTKVMHQGWSSSAVLSMIHPAIIIHWQPFLGVAFLLQEMISFEPVNIPLYIGEELWEPSPGPELECAIKRLTSWVSKR